MHQQHATGPSDLVGWSLPGTWFRLEKTASQSAEPLHAGAGSVGQQGLLPRRADPKLWVMETRGGEEREAVVKLMQKAVTMAAAGTPLAITSVFAQDHLRVRMAVCYLEGTPPWPDSFQGAPSCASFMPTAAWQASACKYREGT